MNDRGVYCLERECCLFLRYIHSTNVPKLQLLSKPGEYTHLGRLVPQRFPFEVYSIQNIGFTGYLAFISSVKPTRKLPPLLVPGTVPC